MNGDFFIMSFKMRQKITSENNKKKKIKIKNVLLQKLKIILLNRKALKAFNALEFLNRLICMHINMIDQLMLLNKSPGT